jgi:biotin---protein ligase
VIRLSRDFASKIVFVQYLMALAVVEGLKEVRNRLRIKIKWPNDVYAEMKEEGEWGERYKKVGGILVNSSYQDGVFQLVVGE